MSDTEPVNETERRARFHFAQGDFGVDETHSLTLPHRASR